MSLRAQPQPSLTSSESTTLTSRDHWWLLISVPLFWYAKIVFTHWSLLTLTPQLSEGIQHESFALVSAGLAYHCYAFTSFGDTIIEDGDGDFPLENVFQIRIFADELNALISLSRSSMKSGMMRTLTAPRSLSSAKKKWKREKTHQVKFFSSQNLNFVPLLFFETMLNEWFLWRASASRDPNPRLNSGVVQITPHGPPLLLSVNRSR